MSRPRGSASFAESALAPAASTLPGHPANEEIGCQEVGEHGKEAQITGHQIDGIRRGQQTFGVLQIVIAIEPRLPHFLLIVLLLPGTAQRFLVQTRDTARAVEGNGPEGQLYKGMYHLVGLRKSCLAFVGNDMEVIETANSHVFGYVRRHASDRVLVLANFSEQTQSISTNQVRLYGLIYAYTDLVTGAKLKVDVDIMLEPYRFAWLVAD